jgi:hypothetical protein
MQYPHYDFNPHYIWKKEMQYMHNNKGYTLYVSGKMQYWHHDPKSTLSMGGQNVKFIYQTWNTFNGI